MENAKVAGVGWQNTSKDTRKSWDIGRSLWCQVNEEGYPASHKRRGNDFSFWAQSVENSQCQIRDFEISFSKIERSKECGTDSIFESTDWNGLTQKSSKID